MSEPNPPSRWTIYHLTEDERRLIDFVRQRLYKNDVQRIDADEMRDLAHKLTFVLDHLVTDDDL